MTETEPTYTIPDRQTGRLLNAQIKRTCICARCGSLLTEVWDEAVECRLRVVCSKDHAHEGHANKAAVERKRQQELVEGRELYRMFPGLSGYREPTQAEIDKDLADLF